MRSVVETVETRSSSAGIRDIEGLGPIERIGPYAIHGVLGSGGMGVVFSGFDEQLERRVAIKRVNRKDVDEPARARSLREAQALARLAHPNIVTVYEAFEVDAQLCIVMEFVPGSTLREWIRERRPSPAAIVEALVQAGRGIAAAHAAGLIHRDLKPDNIMIDDDGRARVMDFGLARTVGEDEAIEVTESSPAAEREPSSTLTGAEAGTPGYMAPEQLRGRPGDARSDVFSFCVLAFEALHGVRPFDGRDDAEVRAATLAGRILAPPDAGVPTWIDAIIRRGLAPAPADRWPSIAALLEALGRDPIARRRRRLRALGLVTLAGLLAAAATWGLLALREQRARARLEAAALERLHAVEATIAEAEASGDLATAEAAFRAFVSDPAHRDTRALSLAWQRRGDRRRDDPGAAKTAYAEAYVSAREPGDQQLALRSLAAVFRDDWDGVALGRSVALLRAGGLDDPKLADAALDAALWQRDLAAARAELERDDHPRASWRATLEQLAQARQSPLAIAELAALPGAGPARIAALDLDGDEILLLDATLAELERHRHDAPLHLIPDTSWALVRGEPHQQIIDVLDGTVLARLAPSVYPVLAPFDVTGDGAPELFFSRDSPTYGFRRLDGFGRSEARERSGDPPTDAGDSVFESFAIGDLDGDGVAELAVAIGPWHRFELRLFGADERGELELLAARRVGRIAKLAPVRRGDRTLLAAFVDNSCPAPELFPEPPHTGAAPGVHLFGWDGAALDEVEFVALPQSAGLGRIDASNLGGVGDLDGDGREDLGLHFRGRGRSWTLLVRQTAAGFEPLVVAGARLWALAQLDDDAASELLLELDPGNRLIALGVGDRTLPSLSPPLAAAPLVPASLDDPLLVERWARANDLAALGLLDSAAASLRDAAPLTADAEAKAALLDRAAALFARAGRPDDVLAVDRRIRDDPELRPRALARDAEALARLGRDEDALAEAEALLETANRSEAEAAVATRLVDELSALVDSDAQIDLRFDEPLARAWQLHTPGALRRDPAAAALEFVIPASRGPIAELPIVWAGGPISIELELTVERLEYGACVRIAIVDEGGHPWLGGGLCGLGGGGRLLHTDRIGAGRGGWIHLEERIVESALTRDDLHIRVAYFPDRSLVEFTHANGDVAVFRRREATEAAAPGDHRLTLAAFSVDDPSLAVGRIHRISIRGARIREPFGDAARFEPARLLAEREPRAALAALGAAPEPPPNGEFLRMIALAELDDLDGLDAAAPALLAALDEPEPRLGDEPELGDEPGLAELALLVRTEPVAAAALRRVAGPALLPALARIWSFAQPHRNDRAIRGELLDALAGLEQFEPTTAEQRRALAALYETRAELWRRSDEHARASRDAAAAQALLASLTSEP